MVYRLIGSLLILGLCVVGYTINSDSSNENVAPVQQQNDEDSLKNFKL
jgi:hypothetical protein